MRDKLIEVLRTACASGKTCRDPCFVCVADHLIAHDATLQNWVPISERLPTNEDAQPAGNVLAIEKHNGLVTSRVWDVVVRYSSEFTHWMPVPRLPVIERSESK